MKSRESDVVVLGAGVIGLSCAYYLLESGRSVTVLDQGRAGGGSSHGNCGTLTPSHAMPLAMPGVVGTALKWLMRADAPLRIKPRLDPGLIRWLVSFIGHSNWQDFGRTTAIKAPFLTRSLGLIAGLIEKEQLDCEFQQSGTLHVYRNEKALVAASWYLRTLSEVGIDVEVLDGRQIETMEPALKPGVAGGFLNPGDARLRPDRFVAELARLVRERGGMIEEEVCVESLTRERGRVASIQTSKGSYRPRDVVFALGAWSPKLAGSMGVRIPIQPGKGYSITYSRPDPCPRIPLALREPSVCVTAWESGYRLGSTMEFAGYDTSLNPTRLNALRRAAADYLRDPEGAQTVEEWFGWRPMTPDDLPVIGRVPGIENLCMATGHGMLGVSMSAMTGMLVSEILGGGPTSLDCSPFSSTRFS
ncbi:NAD(P)/FAD-dependent oxidoreductase [Dokdonella sp.]|uniref:NAD(P)/FAD-dependent oxidoreductase n=1 Tax=Dokdonella sp. TaxID=2291710 RepID=UPI003C33A1BB